MKQITPNYAKPLTGKLVEQVNLGEVRCFPTKEFFRRVIMVAFAFVLFLPFAFAQKGTITGTVTGSEGALQSATVTAGKTTVLTDNKGRFSILLNAGNYTLVITHVGYKKILEELNVTNG
jgi:hypothetical protein